MFSLNVTQVAVKAQEDNIYYRCDRIESFERLPLPAPTEPKLIKPWNILLYSAADFAEGQGFSPLYSFASFAGASVNSNVLILEDQAAWSEQDVILSVDHVGCGVRIITPVLDLGGAETDKSETLAQFLRFAQEWFPSERTLLFMYGHGGAWNGACLDETTSLREVNSNGVSWLAPTEMRSALEQIGGIDALTFPAPCFGGERTAASPSRHVIVR